MFDVFLIHIVGLAQRYNTVMMKTLNYLHFCRKYGNKSGASDKFLTRLEEGKLWKVPWLHLILMPTGYLYVLISLEQTWEYSIYSLNSDKMYLVVGFNDEQ